MKRIFTAILSLALVSAGFIGCETETPPAVEKDLGKATIAIEGVGESAEVFYYGVEKTYTLEHVINDATVSAPQGWTATYDAANNELTVSSPATAGTGAKSGAVVVKGTDNIKREATATLNVTVREPDAYAFADEAFRNYLAKNYGGEDGVLSADELAAITVLDLRGTEMAPNFRYEGLGITSLDGIEQLVNLEKLYISNNNVGEVDLSANTKLQVLHCYFNGLSSLDLKANTALTELYCFHNNLTSLDLSANTALTTVYCQSNALTEVKFPANSKIVDLNVSKNQLAAFDATAHKDIVTLDASTNALTAIDVTACGKLANLNVENNLIESIDLSKASTLVSLNVANNQLAALDLNGCSALTELVAAKNALTSVDLGGCPNLESANVSENAITSLAMSDLDKLTYLGCWNNQLTELPLAECPNLERLLANDNQLAVVDLSPVKKIVYAKMQNNPFTSVNLNGCAALTYLSLDTSADAHGEGCLRAERDDKQNVIGPRRFYLSGLPQTSLELDLSGLWDADYNEPVTGVIVIGCTKLTSLDVSKFTEMTYLNAAKNALTAIDLSANTALEQVILNDNKLSAISVKGLEKLALLNIVGMGSTMTNIDLEGVTTVLEELYIVSAKDNSIKWAKNGNGTLTISGSNYKDLALNTTNTTINSLVLTQNSTLKSLDITACPQLTKLQLQNSIISALDLSKCTELTELQCNNNDLSSLDLSNNPDIAMLNLSNNRIESIDLSKVVALKNLIISGNYVSTLNLTQNTNLEGGSIDATNNFNLATVYMPASLEGKKVTINVDKTRTEVIYGSADVEVAGGVSGLN
ncbi:MAG: hypothetical protein IJ014_03920 [Rikenellaceae bacterium]|nr:hypothetical protein [Rikenellaceae bacterium]